MLSVLESWVFDGRSGPLNVRGTAFQSRLGWNHEVYVVARPLADEFKCIYGQ